MKKEKMNLFFFMSKKGKIVLTTVLATIAAITMVVLIVLGSKGYLSKYEGEITVEVINLDKTEKDKKEIKFKKDDNLLDIIQENFENVTYENGMIMSIEDYVTPSDWSTFIMIYVDGQMSEVGLKDIKYKDGTLITFQITSYNP